jgi:hypothetical protein
MTFVSTDCSLAMSALLHALPASPTNPVIAGMPATVFGNVVSGLAGSVFTLFGVLLSNRHNRRLKRGELDHDATQPYPGAYAGVAGARRAATRAALERDPRLVRIENSEMDSEKRYLSELVVAFRQFSGTF